MLSYWPEEMIVGINNTEMKLELSNGSIWQVVGTDNVDRLVGANPVGCVFSEYSLQDPRAWDYVRPILAENDGWAMFIYTPRGRNHGYTLHKMAQKNPTWFSQVLTRDDTNAIPASAIQEELDAGMPTEMVEQEFFCSFNASLVGAYFAQQIATAYTEKRIGRVPWEPRLPVNTAWDLGMGDSTAIWFHQAYGNENRIIDYYESSGMPLSHYAKVLKEKPYVYGKHHGPHDLRVREMGTGKSRFEVARTLGLRFNIVKNLPIDDGIDAVRNFLMSCWIDEVKCERGLEGLKQYRKDFDEVRKVYRDKPVHDWSSHPADAFRYLAVGERHPTDQLRKLPREADSDYNVLTY